MDILSLTHTDTDSSPLHQNLILKLVLEHVGKAGIADLKNCRLVSRVWNKVAVQVLEEHDFALELDYEKILKFESVLFSAQLSRILPEHEQEQLDELESLRISFSLFPNHRSDHLSETGKAVQLLLNHPHLRVGVIRFSHTTATADYDLPMLLNEQGNLELFSLFKLASKDLIRITIFTGALDPRHFETFDFNGYSSLTFPKLTSVFFKILSFSNDDAGNEQIDLTKHVISIVNNAPKLSKLVLKVSDGGSEERVAESVKKILQSCSTSLEWLAIQPAEFGDSFKLLLDIKLPKLIILRLIGFGLLDVSVWLYQFVVQNCPALRGIGIELEKLDSASAQSEDGEDGNNFHQIPNILSLTLFSNYAHTVLAINNFHTTFTRMTSKFPSLRFMNGNLWFLFNLGKYLKMASGQLLPPPDHGDYPVLTNVSILAVQISFYNNEMFDLLDYAGSMYQHTFPNVKELRIIPYDNLGSVSSDNDMIRIIEFLCSHQGIEKLEIQKYGKPWLEQIPQPLANLQGLKVLKLIPPKSGGYPGVNLPALLARFPGLEHIQFGNEVVSGVKLQAFQDTLKRFATPR